ncbi:MAG: hypothetical protein ABFS14_10305 [Gemmatimonadota bacterium]
MKTRNRTTFSAFALLFAAAAALPSEAAAQAPGQQCVDNPKYSEFDFWVGDWTVTNAQGNTAGTNKIEKIEKGCLLLESWTSARGGTGTSINYWDPVAENWTQVWVSAGSTIIRLQGGLKDSAMVLEGTWQNPSGQITPMRGTWTPLEDGSVRQLFQVSNDDGATWSVWFDGNYVRTDTGG